MTESRKLSDSIDDILTGSGKVAGQAARHGPFGGRARTVSVGLSAALLAVLYFAARVALEWPWPTAARVVIALAPLPAFLWLLWSFIAQLTDADELERRIQLEALAMAFPLTLILLMTLGLLQIAIPLSPDDWSYRHIWPFLYVFYLFGLLKARRRYE